jgi:hypothetical protein
LTEYRDLRGVGTAIARIRIDSTFAPDDQPVLTASSIRGGATAQHVEAATSTFSEFARIRLAGPSKPMHAN